MSEENKPGIDTEEERRKINYHPSFEYKKEQEPSEYQYEDELNQEDLIIEEEDSIEEILDIVEETLSKKEQVEQKFKEKLKDTIISSSNKIVNEILKRNNLALTPDVYKEKRKSDKTEDIILTEEYEKLVSGIDGSLASEVYIDFLDIDTRLSIITSAFESMLGHLFFETSVSFPIDEDMRLSFLEKEKEVNDTYASTIALEKDTLAAYIDKSLKEEEVSKEEEALVSIEKDKTLIEKEKNTRENLLYVFQNHYENYLSSLNLIDKLIDFQSLSRYKEEGLYHIFRQVDDDTIKSLSKMNNMLVLGYEKRNTLAIKDREEINRISDEDFLSSLLNDIEKSSEIRRHWFSDSLFGVEQIENETENKAIDTYFDYIVEGLEESERRYKEEVSDYYRTQEVERERRQARLNQVIEKDGARTIYQLVSHILEKTNTSSISKQVDLKGFIQESISDR